MVHTANWDPALGDSVTWLLLYYVILTFNFANLIDEYFILICITVFSSKTMILIGDSLFLKGLMIISCLPDWFI